MNFPGSRRDEQSSGDCATVKNVQCAKNELFAIVIITIYEISRN